MDTQCGKTHRLSYHEPCPAAAILVSKYPAIINRTFIDCGDNALDSFLEWLIEQKQIILNYLRQNRPMNTLSIEENDRFMKATLCHICIRQYQPFIESDPNFRKVRDHDHITGNFIDAAHDICNRLRRVVYEIPVFFHNFRGYDLHLIVHALAKYPYRELNVIGQTMEKYMQIFCGVKI